MLLALSGLALFHPSLFFLTGLFGGGQTDARDSSVDRRRAVLQLLRAVPAVLESRICGRRKTAPGSTASRDVLTGHEERLPEVGKYNAGQKFVFWAMSILIIVLIVTGLVDLGSVFRSTYTSTRDRSARGADPFDRGGRPSSASGSSTSMRRSGMRGTIQRHGPGPCHRRLGLALPSQVVARAGVGQAWRLAGTKAQIGGRRARRRAKPRDP